MSYAVDGDDLNVVLGAVLQVADCKWRCVVIRARCRVPFFDALFPLHFVSRDAGAARISGRVPAYDERAVSLGYTQARGGAGQRARRCAHYVGWLAVACYVGRKNANIVGDAIFQASYRVRRSGCGHSSYAGTGVPR